MYYFFIFFCLFLFDLLSAQSKDIKALDSANISQTSKIENLKLKPLKNPYELSATKAGLYSAILPGLGQYYNKKYWKIPIVWGAIGTGIGVIIWNDNQYSRYRNAFVSSLNGFPHEFSDIPSATSEALGRAQDQAKRQRDYAIAITGLIYILGIMDAVVDAHLNAQRHDPDLAVKPAVLYNEFSPIQPKWGISINYKF